MNRYRAWISSLPGWLFAIFFAGLLGAVFGLGVLWWYLARHMGWWTFALVVMATELFGPTRTSIGRTRRERRQASEGTA